MTPPPNSKYQPPSEDQYKPATPAAAPKYKSTESYSVDHMMNRLKRSEKEKRAAAEPKGELITREDGTQVIKVRKRKRRSKQPSKKSRSKTHPKLKWALLGTIASLFILSIVGTVIIIAKYNGRKFKATTEKTITQITGAKTTEVTQLRVTPLSARATKADITWNERSFLKTATFRNIKAKLLVTSFLSSDWIGEEVVANRGDIFLQQPSSTPTNQSDPIESPYRFSAFRSDSLDLHFGSDKKSPSIKNLSNVALRKHRDGYWQVSFQEGTLNIPSWPKLSIYSGVVTLKDYGVEIVSLLKPTIDVSGEISINGRIAKDLSKPVVLDIKAKSYPIQDLLGKELGRIIKGPIQSDMGSLSYDYSKSPTNALSFILPFNSSSLHLSGLPLLKDLKDITGDTMYVNPSFNTCSGTITRTTHGVTLSDLNFYSSGALTMKGLIRLDAQSNLSGTLKVGIPARLFGRSRPIPPIFSEPHNGFVFVDVTLSGNIHNPYDNLHELLEQSSKSRSTLQKTRELDQLLQ